MLGDALIQALRGTREVYQPTQAQPFKGTVPVIASKAHSVLQWDRNGAAIHATRAMLSAPVWGSTNPGDFITISGQAPKAPTVVHVPTIAGSNAPQGGM